MSSPPVSPRKRKTPEVASCSQFQKCEINMKIALAPAHIGHQSSAIKATLNSFLFKYNLDLDGIPLLYEEIKTTKGNECSRIIGEQPYLHQNINTTVVMFKPIVGELITGTIKSISSNLISLLVYGMFNASISSSQIAKSYAYNESSNSWESPDGDMSEGDVITFKILRYEHLDDLLHITGSKK